MNMFSFHCVLPSGDDEISKVRRKKEVIGG
jgi:hypothetical protein